MFSLSKNIFTPIFLQIVFFIRYHRIKPFVSNLLLKNSEYLILQVLGYSECFILHVLVYLECLILHVLLKVSVLQGSTMYIIRIKSACNLQDCQRTLLLDHFLIL